MNRQTRRRQAQQAARRRASQPFPDGKGGMSRGRRLALFGGAGLVALVLMAFAGYLIWGAVTAVPPEEDDSPDLPGVYYPHQGRAHLNAGETYDGYNSDPPTSGPHSPESAGPGIYREPIPKEVLVHSLEHGTVLVLYNCPEGCDDLRDSLEAIVAEYGEDGRLVLAAPYPDMDARIALVAWTRLDTFDELDEGRVRAFIEAHERRFNPEGI